MTAPSNAAVLRDIDSALIGVLALATFGPAEQGTADSVRQVCAKQVLLHRLRAARTAVRELADALDISMTPARLASSPTGAGAIATRGGPAQDLARSVKGPASGIAQVERMPGVGLAEGRHRLVGAVCTLPDGTPPFPGSPPTPPPPSPRS